MVGQGAGDVLRVGASGGQAKSRPGPEHAPDEGEGVAGGGRRRVVPGGGAGGAGLLPQELVGQQGCQVRENSPSRARMMSAMARSLQCRCVSAPTWARASSKVVSICQCC